MNSWPLVVKWKLRGRQCFHVCDINVGQFLQTNVVAYMKAATNDSASIVLLSSLQGHQHTFAPDCGRRPKIYSISPAKICSKLKSPAHASFDSLRRIPAAGLVATTRVHVTTQEISPSVVLPASLQFPTLTVGATNKWISLGHVGRFHRPGIPLKFLAGAVGHVAKMICFR